MTTPTRPPWATACTVAARTTTTRTSRSWTAADATAQYKVLAKVEGDYSELTAQSKCEAEAKDFEYVYTETNGSKSFLLCLKDK